MWRRKFLQYSALGSASLVLNLSLVNQNRSEALLSANLSDKQLYDWILLYWMPYDNDLSRFGLPILEMLSKGVQSDNVLVLVQSELSGAKNLSRDIITQGHFKRQELQASNSSSERTLAEYLNWAQSQFEAKKWAIIFLGHGGHLDQISPDDHPEPASSSGTQWMNIQKLSDVIASFNRQVDNRVELFFFQNCTKGTIEANYTVRDTAKYTLSSQLELGVPNYYYEPLLNFLGSNPEINGGQLAEKIMEFEPRNMYFSYTAVNNQAIRVLPSKINSLIESLISSNINSINLNELTTYSYFNEQFCDLVLFFQTITNQSGASQEKYNDFVSFLKKSILYKVQSHGTMFSQNIRSRVKSQELSGLGIFLPRTRHELEKYRYLQVFSDLKLAQLFDTILVN